jgi:methylmalonyl-CoA mutase N-terminal domain/subunit
MHDKIKSQKENWEKTKVDNFIKKTPERKEKFETDAKIEIERLYTPQEYNYDNIGFPGEYPYTRGPYPTMYRGRYWTMRQYAGFANAEESNKRYKFLLEQGTTGLSIAFDLPTQIGYDSNHPIAKSEVGKVGVAIDSLKDMEILFDGIELQKISTSMTINATASILLAMYVTIAKKQGADLRKISGTIQNDILKEYIARGTYIYPPKSSMRLTTNIFEWCSKNLPNWNPISISGYHIREAGSDAVQEVAFTLANGIEYVASAVKSGLDVDSFSSRLSFFFNVHNNFFEEIAKFRAARRMWAKIMKEKFGAKKEESWKLRFHSQTAGSTLTAQQIDNNVVRITLQALASVLGGTQSLHTNARDEALSLPTEESVRIALRTQQIIAMESGVTDTIDPLAGSYFVESLTDQIEEKANEYLQKIEEMGGSIRAIEKNYFQNEIAAASYRYQQKIESKDKIIVGMNKFLTEENIQPKTFSIDPEVSKKQIEKLENLKKTRDNQKVESTLSALTNAAKDESANLMPFILECVENYATLGEISDSLRKIWGEYKG